jgi:hypothetical protein
MPKATIKTKEERILELYKFPFQVGVKKLYKYRSMASEQEIDWLEEVFRDRKIYFPSPIQLNDPFECRPQIIYYRSASKIKAFFEGQANKRFPHFNRRLRREEERKAIKRFKSNQDQFIKASYDDFIQKTGLYCVSQINDDLLMWSHYSNGHRGVVLEFDATKENTLFWEALDVHYDKEYPVVNIMEIGEPEEYRKLLLVKFVQWGYEKEWRIIRTPGEGGPRKYGFAPELLTGVIMGAVISPENRERILKWVKDYSTKITLYQAKINTTKYQLDIESI